MQFITNLLNRATGLFKPDKKTFFVYPGRTAGERVDYDTAMTYSAVYRSINLISESIAGLPWRVMKRENREGRIFREQLLTHPASSILDLQANNEIDSFQFRQALVAHGLTRGNGYAEIELDRSNRPLALHLLSPDRVTPDRDESGELFYKVTNQGGRPDTELSTSEIFHLKGLGFDGLTGYSVINLAARSIGLGMATEQFGADFFSNGAHAGGVLQHPKGLSDIAHERLKESLIEATGRKKSSSPLILEEGMTWETVSIPPDDAQFLETRKFNIAEIARWYGVPLHKLMEMDKSSFNNIEQQNIEFVTNSLLSWSKRLEIEANIKLISRAQRGRVYTKLNLNGLMRGDTQSRGDWYTKMHTMGVYSVNKILELEDENPIGPEGDKHLVQLNLTTLDKVGEITQNEANEEIATKMDEPAREPDTQNQAFNSLVMAVIDKTCSRATGRVNDSLNKNKPFDEFSAYLDKFIIDQADYLHKNLNPLLEAFNVTIDLDQLNATIEAYTESLKFNALTCHYGKQGFREFTDDKDFLIEALFTLFNQDHDHD